VPRPFSNASAAPEPSTIDVWTVDVAAVAAHWERWTEVLADDERQRMARYLRAEDRRRFGVSRAVLRRLVGSRLGEDPARLRFSANRFGKPVLVPPGRGTPPIAFSVAHSGGFALVGLGERSTFGVDLERIPGTVGFEDLVQAVLAPEEVAAMRDLDGGRRRREFYRRWAIKEAYLKALGVGLVLPPNRIVIHHACAGAPEAERYTLGVRGRWTVRVLDEPEGYAAAVAAFGDRMRFRFWGSV
jgi:4'-phosphopantetheinyl transferase